MVIINDDMDEDYGNDRIQMLIKINYIDKNYDNSRIKVMVTINIMVAL